MCIGRTERKTERYRDRELGRDRQMERDRWKGRESMPYRQHRKRWDGGVG